MKLLALIGACGVRNVAYLTIFAIWRAVREPEGLGLSPYYRYDWTRGRREPVRLITKEFNAKFRPRVWAPYTVMEMLDFITGKISELPRTDSAGAN